MADKPHVALIMPQETRDRVIDPADLAHLESFAEVVTPPDEQLTTEGLAPILKHVDAAITGWKTPPLPITGSGRLRFVAHSAGSVRPLGITEAIAEGAIRASNSAAVIGGAVAEFALAHMLAYLRRLDALNSGMHKRQPWLELKYGDLGQMLQDQDVGLVGAGHVGRLVIGLLHAFGPRVRVYDPYLSEDRAQALGVERASLEEIFENCSIVSLHAPVIPETRHMIKDHHLALLADGALLINTARAAIIEEPVLIDHLRRGRFTAALDVFEEEPLPDDSPLRDMENVLLSPHASGHSRGSYLRQGRNAIDEVHRFLTGAELQNEIARESVLLNA